MEVIVAETAVKALHAEQAIQLVFTPLSQFRVQVTQAFVFEST